MSEIRTIRNCNVAVIGGAGFLGSHLVNHLIEDRACKVLVVDNLVAGKSEFIHPKANFLFYDIAHLRASEQLAETFANHGTEYIWNYASYPYVPDSYKDPLLTLQVNTLGAFNVMQAAQKAGVKGMLQVSSAEVYGSDRRILGNFGDDETPGLTPNEPRRTNEVAGVGKVSEEYEIECHSTYGASKAAIDALVQVRWKEAQTPCLALRQFNCVGERETHPYIIPEIISQLYKGQWQVQHTFVTDPNQPILGQPGSVQLESSKASKVLKLGNNTSRDFLYAGDAVRMAVELLEKGQWGEVYNLGSESHISIYDLAQKLSDLIGCGRVTIEQDPARVRPWDIWHLQSDNTKIYRTISARPTVSLEEALKRTITYYESNGRKWVWQEMYSFSPKHGCF